MARGLNGRSIFEGRWDHLFQQFITVVLDDPGFILVKGSTAVRRSGEKSFACACKLVYFIGKAHERPSPFHSQVPSDEKHNSIARDGAPNRHVADNCMPFLRKNDNSGRRRDFIGKQGGYALGNYPGSSPRAIRVWLALSFFPTDS